MTSHTGFETAEDARRFIFAGNATVTLTSLATGTHFTFKVRKKDVDDADAPFFVSVLNGGCAAPPAYWPNYMYIGFVPAAPGSALVAGRKDHPDAPSFKAFDWAIRHLLEREEIPEQLTIQHEGKCCRCARKLTHPDSIASGIGPECATKMF
jgi:hypothetical protein